MKTYTDDPLDIAQQEHRPHSLIASRRFWQQVATAPGVVAWGYAYEGGHFFRQMDPLNPGHFKSQHLMDLEAVRGATK